MNGILTRSDALDLIQRVPFGIIPAGSGNALANTIGVSKLDTSIQTLSQGTIASLDLFKVALHPSNSKGNSNNEIISFCVFSWGLHARIVSDSEKLRWFGNRRFIMSAMANVLFRPLHYGKLEMLNAKKLDPVQKSFSSEIPQLSISGPFGYFLATKVTHLESIFPIAPYASLDDQYMDLILIPNSAKRSQISDFLKAVYKNQHTTLPYVQYYKVKSFQLKPDSSKSSPICIDGELFPVPPYPIKVELLPSNMRPKVFIPLNK